MRKTMKAWVVVSKKTGEVLEGQFTLVMGDALREFYKRSEYVDALPCTITYETPS